jgi:hypothetical protein
MNSSPSGQPTSDRGQATPSDDLDALIAAPDHHTLLFENDRVRVLDTCIASGDQTPVHTHCWPAALYAISWSDFVRYDDRGSVLLDSRTVPALQDHPDALWSGPLPPHSLRNIGEVELRIITVEVKQ